MDVTLRLGPCVVDVERRRDLSLPIDFHREHSRAFSLPPATTRAVEAGGFVGDVRRGGSCNCETHALTPHADGTHTEGPGHLLAERLPVSSPPPVQLAVVVRVVPRLLGESVDDVSGNHRHDDRVVDRRLLEEALDRCVDVDGATAIVVATMSGAQARAANHSGTNPTYLTVDAAAFVRERGFLHLLVDLPSIDREDDGGLLAAHRAFFELPTGMGAPVVDVDAIVARTVTELCVVDDDIAEGPWALFLQVAPIEADAAPSRPLLAPLVKP